MVRQKEKREYDHVYQKPLKVKDIQGTFSKRKGGRYLVQESASQGPGKGKKGGEKGHSGSADRGVGGTDRGRDLLKDQHGSHFVSPGKTVLWLKLAKGKIRLIRAKRPCRIQAGEERLRVWNPERGKRGEGKNPSSSLSRTLTPGARSGGWILPTEEEEKEMEDLNIDFTTDSSADRQEG